MGNMSEICGKQKVEERGNIGEINGDKKTQPHSIERG